MAKTFACDAIVHCLEFLYINIYIHTHINTCLTALRFKRFKKIKLVLFNCNDELKQMVQ